MSVNLQILQHEILETLVSKGVTIKSNGSDATGYILIDKFIFASAHLAYGKLLAKVNGQEVDSESFSSTSLKVEQIIVSKYSRVDFMIAIQILEFNGHIKDNFQDYYRPNFERVISLTEKGLIAFNTKYYIKESDKEKYAEILQKSTLNTNFWMKIFTGLTALSAIFTLFIQISTCNLRIKDKLDVNVQFQYPIIRKDAVQKCFDTNKIKHITPFKAILKE